MSTTTPPWTHPNTSVFGRQSISHFFASVIVTEGWKNSCNQAERKDSNTEKKDGCLEEMLEAKTDIDWPAW